MAERTRRCLAATIPALLASCAGVSYRSIPQEPPFAVPVHQDLTALDAEIAAVNTEITQETARATQNEDEARAKARTLAGLQQSLVELEAEKAKLEQENRMAARATEIEARNRENAESGAASDAECGLGIRFYQPSPYLLVYADGKGGLSWELHHLPDPTKKMSARPYNYMSTLEAKLTFDDHFRLTKTHEMADTTAIPAAVLGKIAELAPALAAAFNEPSAKDGWKLPAPLLYKIVHARGEVRLVGGETDPIVVHATLGSGSTEAKPKDDAKPQGGGQ